MKPEARSSDNKKKRRAEQRDREGRQLYSSQTERRVRDANKRETRPRPRPRLCLCGAKRCLISARGKQGVSVIRSVIIISCRSGLPDSMPTKTKDGWATQSQIMKQEKAWKRARIALMVKLGEEAMQSVEATKKRSAEIFQDVR